MALAGRNMRQQAAYDVLTVVAATDPVVAAGATPTKAEFDAVVTLALELKSDLNAVIAALKQ